MEMGVFEMVVGVWGGGIGVTTGTEIRVRRGMRGWKWES